MDILYNLIMATFRQTTPILLAATGGVYSDRSGLANITLEASMIMGAFFAVYGSYTYGSSAVGILFGLIAGVVTGVLFALICLYTGGNNVVVGISFNLIAWGLTTSFTHAERLKTLHGCAFMTSQDKEDLINVYPVGEEDDSLIKQVPKAELISIITPRIEEIFELVNKKLAEHGLRDISSHRVVLTGGGAQLSGIRDIANMVLDKQVRIGRPKNVINLPDNLYNPCFSTAIGLLLFALNYSEKKPNKIISKPASSGTSFGRILDWLKQSF